MSLHLEIFDRLDRFNGLIENNPTSGEPLRILVEIEGLVRRAIGVSEISEEDDEPCMPKFNGQVDQFLIEHGVPEIDSLLDKISNAAMTVILAPESEGADEQSFLKYIETLGVLTEQFNGVIVDTKVMPQRKGDNPATEVKVLNTNKLKLLIELLRNHEIYTDDLCIVKGENRDNMRRNGTFFCVEIPALKKTVLIHPEYGEVTIVLPGIFERSLMFAMNKDQLEKELNGHLVPFYESSPEQWTEEMKMVLDLKSLTEERESVEEFNLTQKIRSEIVANFPSPVDLWKYPGSKRSGLRIGGLTLIMIARKLLPDRKDFFPNRRKSDLKELLKHIYLGVDVETALGETLAPEGWRTRRQARIELGISRELLNKLIEEEKLKENHPNNFGNFTDDNGKEREFLSGKVFELIRELPKTGKQIEAKKEDLSGHLTFRKTVEKYNLPLTQQTQSEIKAYSTFFPGSVKELPRKILFKKEMVESFCKHREMDFKIPTGWKYAFSDSIAELIGYTPGALRKKMGAVITAWTRKKINKGFSLEENSPGFCALKNPDSCSKFALYLSPDFQLFAKELLFIGPPKEGWKDIEGLTAMTPWVKETVSNLIKELKKKMPNEIELARSPETNNLKRYHSPKLQKAIMERLDNVSELIEDWLHLEQICKKYGKNYRTVIAAIERLKGGFKGEMKLMVSLNSNRILMHYSPDFVSAIVKELSKN